MAVRRGWIAGILCLLTWFVMPASFALAPGAVIENRAALTFELRGGTQTITASHVLTAAADAGNSPPHSIHLVPGEVPENSPGALVGLLTADDVDPGDTHAWTTTDPRFAVMGNQLLLTAGQAFDFESGGLTTVSITARDAAGGERVESLVIRILDVNEAPFNVAVTATEAPAALPGAVVGPVSAVDIDQGDVFTWTTDDARFAVIDGVLRLLAGAALAEGEVVELTLTATDRGGLRASTPVTLRSVRMNKPAPTRAVAGFLVLDPVVRGPVALPMVSGRCVDGRSAGIPVVRSGRQIQLPASLDFFSGGAYVADDTVFVRLQDADQNINPSVVETISVEIRTGAEAEHVVLTETGSATGEFTGYITMREDASTAADCSLALQAGGSISLRYVDPDDSTDVATASGGVATVFTVWSSDDGRPLDGVEVALVDAATGMPAQDALSGAAGSAYPAVLRTGAAVTDAAGVAWQPPAGAVLLPRVSPGTYRFQLAPPSGYRFPSGRADADLLQVSGGRYRIQTGSRGESFARADDTGAGFDLPVDVLRNDVFLTKEASTAAVEVGDKLQYRVRVQTGSGRRSLAGMVLADRLPAGFRYEAGSARIEGVAVEPDIHADGQTLRFDLSTVPVRPVVTVTYVTSVSVGSRQGNARNVAVLEGPGLEDAATGDGVSAFADVEVRRSLLTDRAFLTGRIARDCSVDPAENDGPEVQGVANVRVVMEDGTWALSDESGRFHFEDLAAGTHVVQIDPASLPAGMKTIACTRNGRIDSTGAAQFVDLARGALGRVDFAVTDLPPPSTEWSVRLDSSATDNTVRLDLLLRNGELAAEKASVGIVVPDGLAFLPGSARLNGTVLGDPPGSESGALSFMLPALAAESEHVLQVKLARAAGTDLEGALRTDKVIEYKAMVTLTTATGKHRSRAVNNIAALPGALPAIAVRTSGETPGHAGTERVQVVRGQAAVMTMTMPTAEKVRTAPYVIPEFESNNVPTYTVEWLRTQPAEPELIWPPADYNPRIPAVRVVVRHPSGMRPVVAVDGRVVDPVAFEGTTTDHERGLTLSIWKDVPVSERDSRIVVRFLEGDRDTGIEIVRAVHFGQAPVRAELLAERSWLVADGINPPMLAVRLHDRSGKPARPGLSGEFSISAPYAALDRSDQLEVAEGSASARRWQVRRDGIAFIQLEPTTRSGDVLLQLTLAGQTQERISARLLPGSENLMVVGLAEAGIGLSDPGESSPDETSEGRVAFYAKGKVRGDWQLTAAYDSDRRHDPSRHQMLEPGRFYPLYGDGSEQRYDAVSQRRFYVKAERRQFEVEAGDFDTGFDRSELARYQRTLNGARMAWHGDHMQVEGFASDSGSTHVMDVLRGDGTSGLYRLRRTEIIGGTEAVTLVTRDRLHSERVLQRQTLMRYLDYSLDPAQGTLLFKQPVQSQDNQFNPVFIEVTYDVQSSAGGSDIVAGMRAELHSDDQMKEAGITMLRDDAGGESLELDGIYLRWRIGTSTLISLEAAQTRSDSVDPARAYIAAVDHRGEKITGQAYFRQQDAQFGVGLSPVTEVDTRKYGVDAEYRAAENLMLRAQAFRQETMEQGGQRDVAGMEARLSRGTTSWRSALQSVREQAVSGEHLSSDLLGLGVARTFFDGRFGLRAESDINLRSGNGSAAYPDRTVVGADYAVTDAVTLLLEQELASGGFADTRQTRLGVRARPWTGQNVESWIGQEMTENGPRLFSNTGLAQQWQVNEHWLLDAGMDQVKTLRGTAAPQSASTQGAGSPTFNPAAPAYAGSDGTDFTAWFAGATMRREQWHVTTRLERHRGDQQDKWNWLFGAARELEGGKAVSASGGWFDESSAGGAERHAIQVRLGFAFRPDEATPEAGRWAVFNRLDLNLEESRSAGWMTRNHSLVENLHVNWRRGRHEAGVQAGVRYAIGEFDSGRHDGFTALAGAQYRFDLSSRWDVGAHARLLRSFDAEISRWNYGVEIGRGFGEAVWVSAGYNFAGFTDDGFAAADHTARGPYLKFRMRFDQEHVRRYLGFITARPAAAPTITSSNAGSSALWQ